MRAGLKDKILDYLRKHSGVAQEESILDYLESVYDDDWEDEVEWFPAQQYLVANNYVTVTNGKMILLDRGKEAADSGGVDQLYELDRTRITIAEENAKKAYKVSFLSTVAAIISALIATAAFIWPLTHNVQNRENHGNKADNESNSTPNSGLPYNTTDSVAFYKMIDDRIEQLSHDSTFLHKVKEHLSEHGGQ
ncbi:MAG: hypothetical protein AAGF85_00735 [Bacteroidota bacterium]